MAGSSSGGPPPSVSSSRLPGPLIDEPEFDRLCSTIPDSQVTNRPIDTRTPPKKFSAAKEEVSESALSEGFMFGAKAPPRPGQFSERLNHWAIDTAGPSGQSQREASVPQPARPNPSKQAPTQHRRHVGAPLDLPELGLPGNSSSNRSPAQEVVRSDLFIGPGPFSNQVPVHVPSSYNPSKSVSKSPSSDHRQLERPSRPQPPHSEPKGEPSLPMLPFQDVRSGSSPHANSPPRAQNSSQVGTPPIMRAQADKRQLEHLKLPLPHVLQINQARGRGTTSSACGDLERPSPAPRTPRTHTRPPSDFARPMLSRPVVNPRQFERTTTSRNRRSESAASNIARKRSTIHKQRSQRDPERKKNAMQQVAEYWNECMRIAEDERDDANWEIERLQSEMRQQEERLNKSLQLLSEKEVQFQSTQAHCKELEDQEAQVATEKLRLSGEVESLRNQLNESKKRAATLGDKSRTYRTKLNEAIAEQQALFLRSRAFYQEAQQELQKEKNNRAIHAQTIDKALEASRQKREELKQCFQDFRINTERECQKKDGVISELETKIRQQEEGLSREQEAAANLRHQIEEQGKIQESIGKVESQVQALLEANAKKDEQDRKKDEMTLDLSSKLDFIMEHLKSSAENASPPVDLSPVIEGLEQKIVTKILPSVHTVVSRQNDAENFISQLKDAFDDNLEDLRSEMKSRDERLSQDREKDELARQELLEFLSRIENGSTKTRQASEQTGQQIREWAESQLEAQKEANNSVENQITQLLKQRESKITELELNLQLMTENYASRVNDMRGVILESDEGAKAQLKSTISAIRDALDNGFEEERARSEQSLSRSEAARAGLEFQLKELQEKLEVAINTRENTDSAGLRLLRAERTTVSDLKQNLARFEGEAAAAEQLHERWTRNIQAIEALRGQLKHMSERLPQVETLGESLGKVMAINQMMNSTADYLMQERCWVTQQLEANTKSGTQSVSSTDISATTSSQVVVGDLSKVDLSAVVKPEAISTGGPSSQLDLLKVTGGQAEAGRRVLVYSPAVNEPSPSPPPSIKMEQQRRREALTLRSILKPQKSSSQPSSSRQLSGETQQGEAQEPLQIPPNHSQYNRPVVGKLIAAPTGGNTKVIEQIRSSLVQPKPMYHGWNLPTVADFEKSAQISSGQGSTANKKHTIQPAESSMESSTKKVKTKERCSQEAVAETSKLVSKVTETRMKQNATTGRPILRTYSRRISA
ncbi:Fc.00g039840.m01.CDS01 [Cosmosporella sp. VM-42]